MIEVRGRALVRSGIVVFFFFQAEDGIRDLVRSRGLGDVYKRQVQLADPHRGEHHGEECQDTAEAEAHEEGSWLDVGLSLIHI